jgi:hypothetical protein
MPVIPVNRVVDKKRIIGKKTKWRGEDEERHKNPSFNHKTVAKTLWLSGRVIKNEFKKICFVFQPSKTLKH